MDYELWFHKEHIMPDHVGKDGSVSPMAFGEWRPATPEEIKEAHGKCGTCKHLSPLHRAELGLCTNDDSHSWDMRVNPATDYCNHHEPKEE